MSQDHVELEREAYDALGSAAQAGDLEAFFREYVHPEIEYVLWKVALTPPFSMAWVRQGPSWRCLR
jgi:hypothetical protein